MSDYKRECDGSFTCDSPRHVHGCYSDNGFNCDDPQDHHRLGVVPIREEGGQHG